MVKKAGVLIFLSIFSMINIGCNNVDKETVLAKNMSVEVKQQQSDSNKSGYSKVNTMQLDVNKSNYQVEKSEINEQVQKVKKVGMITNVYEQNGKEYLDYDEVEFFRDKDANDWTAENESEKDGKNKETAPGRFDKDSGKLYDDYYIRNNDTSLVTYEISPNVQISLCAYNFNIENTIDLQEASYDKFVERYSHIRLFNIYLEDNVIVKIEEEYTP